MLSQSPWLLSEETGEPFRHCLDCRLPLAEIDASWLVTKEYRRGECIMEYAICQRCRDKVADSFSENSKEAVRQFLERRIDWAARVSEFMMDPTLDTRMGACIACRKPREEVSGFGISALFDSGGYLIEGPLPLLLCGGCLADLGASLEPGTLAAWRAFLAEHLEGPDSGSAHGTSGLL